MVTTVQVLLLIFGLLLLASGIVGGGFEIKEIKVPQLHGSARLVAAIVGLAFVTFALSGYVRTPLSAANPAPTSTPPQLTPRITLPPPSLLRIEAENLKTDSNVPRLVSRQPDCCGVHWSNSAQVFFRATAQSQYVTLFFAIDYVSAYRVDVRATRAPDYGIYTVELDGRTLVGAYDAYISGTVGTTVATDTVPLAARTQLGAGQHVLTFRVTGRNSAAAGYFLGIDYIDLTSV